METFKWYKGYGIRYTQINGTTTVESWGSPIKRFVGLGEMKGGKLAIKYIDGKGNR